MLHIHCFTFNPFAENTYVVWDETAACVVIDPGCFNREERNELAAFLKAKSLSLSMVLNTHCHIDHVFGNDWMVKTFQVPLAAHKGDLANLQGSSAYAQMTGLPFDPSPMPTVWIEPGKDIRFGNTVFEVLFTPGHAPGHVSFYHRGSGTLFSGDVLFEGSIGRTDLPGGNYLTLMRSIFDVLLPLPEETVVWPGHGDHTTLGAEKRSNPFILEFANENIQGR